MIVGTSHFVSLQAAVKYYSTMDLDPIEVGQRLAKGIISIGKPNIGPGQRLTTIDNNCRYAIITEEA